MTAPAEPNMIEPAVGVQDNLVRIVSDVYGFQHELVMDPVSARLFAQQVLTAASFLDGESPRRWIRRVDKPGLKRREVAWRWEP